MGGWVGVPLCRRPPHRRARPNAGAARLLITPKGAELNPQQYYLVLGPNLAKPRAPSRFTISRFCRGLSRLLLTHEEGLLLFERESVGCCCVCGRFRSGRLLFSGGLQGRRLFERQTFLVPWPKA